MKKIKEIYADLWGHHYPASQSKNPMQLSCYVNIVEKLGYYIYVPKTSL